MSTPTVRVAHATAAAFSDENFPLPPQICQQLVIAALFGDAVSCYEDFKAKNLPVVLDDFLAGQLHNSIPIWGRQLRDDIVSARAQEAITRLYGRWNAVLPKNEALQFLLLKISDVVTTQIRKHGLFLYTQQLLFTPQFDAIAMRILEAAKLPELPPRQQAWHLPLVSCPLYRPTR